MFIFFRWFLRVVAVRSCLIAAPNAKKQNLQIREGQIIPNRTGKGTWGLGNAS